MLPCWDWGRRSNFLSHRATLYWQWANHSQPQPDNTKCITDNHWTTNVLSHWYDSTRKNPHTESGNRTQVCHSQGRHLYHYAVEGGHIYMPKQSLRWHLLLIQNVVTAVTSTCLLHFLSNSIPFSSLSAKWWLEKGGILLKQCFVTTPILSLSLLLKRMFNPPVLQLLGRKWLSDSLYQNV